MPIPTAVPADAAANLPPAGKIDPRGHRFGAGLSALLLVASFATGWIPGVLLALLSIGTSAAFGLRYSIYGVIWRRIARTLRLAKVEPEHEYPPRFAQTLGSVVLTVSLVSFLAGAVTFGWLLALAVAGLQTLLAVTGYCLGCRMYFLRWWVPSVVTSIWTRGASRPTVDSAPIRFG